MQRSNVGKRGISLLLRRVTVPLQRSLAMKGCSVRLRGPRWRVCGDASRRPARRPSRRSKRGRRSRGASPPCDERFRNDGASHCLPARRHYPGAARLRLLIVLGPAAFELTAVAVFLGTPHVTRHRLLSPGPPAVVDRIPRPPGAAAGNPLRLAGTDPCFLTRASPPSSPSAGRRYCWGPMCC